MVPGKAYFNVLKEVASSLDFLMPQYYNGFVRPNTNFPGALSHFTTITNQMFGGDASKIVFGFCITDCASFNSNGSQSASVMTKLAKTYPCNGGAFFWVANDDNKGDWSIPVSSQLALDGDKCLAVSPVSNPVNAPTPAPQKQQEECKDEKTFRYKGKKKCKWVGKKISQRCNKKWKKKRLSHHCPKTCGVCE